MAPPKQLQTDRLFLRIPVIEDAEQIFAKYSQDPEVTKYLVWKPHENIEVTRSIVNDFIKKWETKTEFPWVIIRKADNEILGMIAVRMDEVHGVNFGYVLARQYWGNGYMPEALKSIIEWALKQEKVFRVWAVHDVENPASGRVMEKAGLQFEGILRKWSIHPSISNVPRDCKCYSIVKK